MTLILASNSEIRRHMLTQAGIDYRVMSPEFDEAKVKQSHHGDGASLARLLAEGKAQSIRPDPGDWVIGSDSVVSVDGEIFSKPGNRAEAADHLAAFSGRSMLLSSAVALAIDGQLDWSHADTARLSVRPLGDSFIAAYLDAEWPAIAHCAGAFRMEGRGATLFSAVDGSHFTILGMPLLPLLGALRDRAVLPS